MPTGYSSPHAVRTRCGACQPLLAVRRLRNEEEGACTDRACIYHATSSGGKTFPSIRTGASYDAYQSWQAGPPDAVAARLLRGAVLEIERFLPALYLYLRTKKIIAPCEERVDYVRKIQGFQVSPDRFFEMPFQAVTIRFASLSCSRMNSVKPSSVSLRLSIKIAIGSAQIFRR